jgi:hypothetical protein
MKSEFSEGDTPQERTNKPSELQRELAGEVMHIL